MEGEANSHLEIPENEAWERGFGDKRARPAWWERRQPRPRASIDLPDRQPASGQPPRLNSAVDTATALPEG